MCSACAQTSGIADPLGLPGSSSTSGIGVAVPHLLGQQLARARAGLQRREQPLRLGAAAGRQLVVRPLAGQQRPDAADAGAVIGAAVLVLAVAVAVIAAPAGPVRQFDPQHVIDHLHRVDNARIVRRAQAEAHQGQRVRADQFVRGDIAGPGEAVAHLDRAAEFGARLARHLGGDAHVVAGDADLARESRVGDIDPVLDLLVPGVGGVAQEVGDVVDRRRSSAISAAASRAATSHREGEWRVAGILLPAVLAGPGAMADDEASGAGYHRPIRLEQRRRHRTLAQSRVQQQHREMRIRRAGCRSNTVCRRASNSAASCRPPPGWHADSAPRAAPLRWRRRPGTRQPFAPGREARRDGSRRYRRRPCCRPTGWRG